MEAMVSRRKSFHGAHIRAANYRTEVNFYQHLYGDVESMNTINLIPT